MRQARKRIDFKELSLKIFPYVIFLGFSFAALYVFFYKGVLIGDDLYFHLANISDEYLSLLNEGSISRISTYIASGLGVGGRLFYSPLFHFLAAIIYFVTHGLGGNVVDTIKVVMFVSVFISGVFMYRFVLKTSGNKVAATLAASLYIIYPYRIFDALCRAAFAEALAIAFIPLFFKGLHGLVNFKDEIKVGPFIETIIGGALLFLSHNLTAIFGFIFGIIFLLANIAKIIRLCRKRRYWITGLISIVLLVGLISVQLFPSTELLNLGIYNISNSERMGTAIASVISRVDSAFNFSGFLNFAYMNSRHYLTMNSSILLIQIVSFSLATAVFVIIDKCLAQCKKMKYFHFAISAVIYIGAILIFAPRIEVILGAVAVVVLYFFIDYVVARVKVADDSAFGPIYKQVDFWFLLGIIILTFALITQKWIWTIVPDQLLMIQFPWRLWAYIQFFASWAIGWLVHYFRNKKTVAIFSTVVIGFCLVTNQALPEKRLLRESIENGTSTAEIFLGDGNYLEHVSSIGWNKEYIPQVFFEDGYVSSYPNSLYNAVRIAVWSSFTEAYPLDPVVLSGDATIDVTLRNTPDYELDVDVVSDSLIQMPLIYYPGYRIEVFDDDGNKRREEAINIDGLIAFNVEIGEQSVKISYVGTPVTIVSYVFCGLSALGTAGLAGYYIFFLDKKKKTSAI